MKPYAYTAQIKEQSTMRMVDRLLEKVARFSPCPVKRSSDSQGVYPVTQDVPINEDQESKCLAGQISFILLRSK